MDDLSENVRARAVLPPPEPFGQQQHRLAAGRGFVGRKVPTDERFSSSEWEKVGVDQSDVYGNRPLGELPRAAVCIELNDRLDGSRVSTPAPHAVDRQASEAELLLTESGFATNSEYVGRVAIRDGPNQKRIGDLEDGRARADAKRHGQKRDRGPSRRAP